MDDHVLKHLDYALANLREAQKIISGKQFPKDSLTAYKQGMQIASLVVADVAITEASKNECAKP